MKIIKLVLFLIVTLLTGAATLHVTQAAPAVNVTPVSQSSIYLSWNSDGSFSYDIYRCIGSSCSPGTDINSVGSTSYTDSSGLSPGTTYGYKVCGSYGCSGNGYATTDAATPGKPTYSSGPSAVNQTTVGVGWTRNSPYTETSFDYRVRRSGVYYYGSASAGATSGNVGGLTCNTSYYGPAMRAYVTTNGRTYYSSWEDPYPSDVGPAATTDQCTPGVPSGLSATAASQTQINLSWVRNAPLNESGFGLQYCVGAGCSSWANLPNPPAGATSASHAGLSCGTTYQYRVYSYITGGVGGPYYSGVSNTASVTTNSCDTTPPTTVDDWNDVWTMGSPVTVTLTATDNSGGSGIAYIYYCVDTSNSCAPTSGTTVTITGAPNQVSTGGSSPSVSCADVSECTQYVRYQSRDVAGYLESPIKSERVRQDREDPLSSYGYSVTPGNDPSWYPSRNVVFTGGDYGSGLLYTRHCFVPGTDAATANCDAGSTNASTFTNGAGPGEPPGDGQWIACWRARDNVGNWSVYTSAQCAPISGTGSYNKDATPPSTSVYLVSPALEWRNANFTVQYTDTDLDSGLSTCQSRAYITGQAAPAWSSRTCNGTITVTVGAAGTCSTQGAGMCTVEARSQDAAGNWSSVATVTRSVDYTNPSTTIAPAAGSWQSGNFSATFTDTDPSPSSGFNSCTARAYITGQAASSWNSRTCGSGLLSVTVGAAGTCSTEGANTCKVESLAQDNAGNSTFIVSQTYSVDYTAPTPNPPTVSGAPGSQTSINWSRSTAADSSSGLHSTPYGTSTTSGGTYQWSTLTSWIETNLVANTLYTRYAKARDAVLNETSAGSGSATTCDINPSDPNTLSSPAVSASQCNLSWTDTAANESGFSIERCTGAGCSPTTELITTSQTTYNNTSLSANTSYSYRVRAYVNTSCATYYSGYTNTASCLTYPGTPGTPTFSSVTATSLRVSWTAPTGGASSYKVERCEGSGCTTGFTERAAGVTNLYYDDSATCGTTYRYRVRATNGTGDGNYSSISSDVTTGSCIVVPTAPSSLSVALASGSGQVTLSWIDNSTNEDGFKIYQTGAVSTQYFPSANAGTGGTVTYTVPALRCPADYTFMVRAVTSGVESTDSNTVSAPIRYCTKGFFLFE